MITKRQKLHKQETLKKKPLEGGRQVILKNDCCFKPRQNVQAGG